MQIAVTGSIATDHLMTFPGRFADSLMADKLDKVSLSFLVDELEIRRGGVAANIAFGMGCLGLRPLLVGAVGPDFADYRSWLERHGVDTGSVHVSDVTPHRALHLHHRQRPEPDRVLLPRRHERGPRDRAQARGRPRRRARPRGRRRQRPRGHGPAHRRSAAQRGYAFAADPSQQLARMEGPEIRDLVDGAAYLFTNEYEAALTESKTGWTSDDVLERVDVRVTTLGKAGRPHRAGRRGDRARSTCPDEEQIADPTGVGDAFRAGFLGGRRLGAVPRAVRPGRLAAGDLRHRDGRHPGVRRSPSAPSSTGSPAPTATTPPPTSSRTWPARAL